MKKQKLFHPKNFDDIAKIDVIIGVIKIFFDIFINCCRCERKKNCIVTSILCYVYRENKISRQKKRRNIFVSKWISFILVYMINVNVSLWQQQSHQNVQPTRNNTIKNNNKTNERQPQHDPTIPARIDILL